MIDWACRGMTAKGVAAQHTESVTQSSKPELWAPNSLIHPWLRNSCDDVPFCACVLDCWPYYSHTNHSPEGGHKSVLSQPKAKPPLDGAFVAIALCIENKSKLWRNNVSLMRFCMDIIMASHDNVYVSTAPTERHRIQRIVTHFS